MAIYDNNGTNSVEIGKLYDNNGTTSSQIGKVYDNNGTTNSLIYQLATPFTFLNFSNRIVDTSYAVNYSSFGFAIAEDNSAYQGYRFSHYAMNGTTSIYWKTPRDLTGLTKATITVRKRNSAYVIYFGVSTNTALSANKVDTSIFTKYVSINSSNSTFTLDISGLEGNYYLKFMMQSDENTTSPYVVIQDISFS